MFFAIAAVTLEVPEITVPPPNAGAAVTADVPEIVLLICLDTDAVNTPVPVIVLDTGLYTVAVNAPLAEIAADITVDILAAIAPEAVIVADMALTPFPADNAPLPVIVTLWNVLTAVAVTEDTPAIGAGTNEIASLVRIAEIPEVPAINAAIDLMDGVIGGKYSSCGGRVYTTSCVGVRATRPRSVPPRVLTTNSKSYCLEFLLYLDSKNTSSSTSGFERIVLRYQASTSNLVIPGCAI
jgi:hypothetical protein